MFGAGTKSRTRDLLITNQPVEAPDYCPFKAWTPQQVQRVEYHLADSRGGWALDFWFEIARWQALIPQISRSAVISAFKRLRNDLVTSQVGPCLPKPDLGC